MTHPGVGALTALAFGLIIATPERFARSKELSSYLGLVPGENGLGSQARFSSLLKRLV